MRGHGGSSRDAPVALLKDRGRVCEGRLWPEALRVSSTALHAGEQAFLAPAHDPFRLLTQKSYLGSEGPSGTEL